MDILFPEYILLEVIGKNDFKIPQWSYVKPELNVLFVSK